MNKRDIRVLVGGNLEEDDSDDGQLEDNPPENGQIKTAVTMVDGWTPVNLPTGLLSQFSAPNSSLGNFMHTAGSDGTSQHGLANTNSPSQRIHVIDVILRLINPLLLLSSCGRPFSVRVVIPETIFIFVTYPPT